MAFVKRDEKPSDRQTGDKRGLDRDMPGLLAQLVEEDVDKRRWAAMDLATYPEAVGVLCERLPREADYSVREVILSSLLRIGGDQVVAGLTPLLRGEDVPLRNGAVEVLQRLPDAVAPYMELLLEDPDSDVRIFAIDILRLLTHPKTPEWLLSVIGRHTHVNVVAAAVDRLADVGTPDAVPHLEALKQRLPNEPYIEFAVNSAIRRIRGG